MNSKIKRDRIRIHIRILALIMALLPVDAAISGSVSPVSLLVVAYLLLALYDAISNDRNFRRCLKYLMAFYIYCALSLLWGAQVWRRYFIASLFQNLLIVFFAANDVYSVGELKHIKTVMKIGVVLAITTGLIGRIFSEENRLIIQLINPVDPNEYAMGICFCAAFLFSLIRESTHRLLISCGIVLCFVVIFMTGSRGGMLTFFAVFAVWLIFYAKRLRIKAVIFCCLMFLIVYFAFFDKINGYLLNRLDIFASLKSDGGAGRFNIWKAAFTTYKQSNLFQKILGCGYGLFAPTVNYIPKGHVEPYMSHNMWIDCLITGGLIGLILLCVLFIVAIKTAFKNHNCWGVLALVFFIMTSFSIDAQLYKLFAIVISVSVSFGPKQLKKENIVSRQSVSEKIRSPYKV